MSKEASKKSRKRKAEEEIANLLADKVADETLNVKKKNKKDKKKKKKKKKHSKDEKPLAIVSSKTDVSNVQLSTENPTEKASSIPQIPIIGIESPGSNPTTTRMRTRSMDKRDKIQAAQSIAPQDFRKKNDMEIEGMDEKGLPFTPPTPIMTFKQAPFSPILLRLFDKEGFVIPTPIQSQAWPICMQGRDMISVARTGSGKTLGFLLPTFHHIGRLEGLDSSRDRPVNEPLGIVLAPTRELAMQINVEAEKFGRLQGINSVCIYGGESKWHQISKMKRMRPKLIIATPGRLNDLCQQRKVGLKRVGVMVLDEADRMLDMGFEPQLDEIRSHMLPQITGADRPLPSSGQCGPTARQTLLFTATWPKSVERIANKLLHNPIRLHVGKSGVLVANENICQEIIVLPQSEKHDRLLKIVSDLPKVNKTLVFIMRKSDCDKISNEMWEKGYNCDAIHGDKEQWRRTKIMVCRSYQLFILFHSFYAILMFNTKHA